MTEAAGLPSRIRVVCDLAQLHPVRKPEVLVNAFRYIDEGRWTSGNTSPWLQQNLSGRRGKFDPGTTLAGDEVYSAEQHGWSAETRSVYALECFKCHRFTSNVREATLFTILNDARDARRDVLVLREVAAILSGRT